MLKVNASKFNLVIHCLKNLAEVSKQNMKSSDAKVLLDVVDLLMESIIQEGTKK